MRRTLVLLVLAALTAACRPDLGSSPSLVDGPRLLDVVAEPPEAAAGASVSFRALVVDPRGTVDAEVTWNLCLDPKPASVNNVVGDDCIFDPASSFGSGQGAVTSLPQDTCARFGPDTPPTVPGQPPVRARDPDITGGFYQPLRAALPLPGGAVLAAVGLVRITCSLPNAPLEIIQAYRMRYRPNQNPTIDLVGALDGDTVGPVPAEVGPGQRVTFVVAWPGEAAETFPVFDLQTRVLVDVRESLRASWFGTAGEFDSDRTGRASDDAALDSENVWTAPDTPGPVRFWIVLRDSRGGAASQSFGLEVR